jgi:hypothetical protein
LIVSLSIKEQTELDREQAFGRVHAELDHFTQASGLGVLPHGGYDSAEQFRGGVMRKLQRALPATTPGSIRAEMPDVMRVNEPEIAARCDRQVLAHTIKNAHEAPELRPVITKDQSGREIVEFYGGQGKWLDQFRAKPRLMIKLGGAPFGDG